MGGDKNAIHVNLPILVVCRWGRSDDRIKIPISNECNRQTCFGALNSQTKELILQEYDVANGVSTIDGVAIFIKYLRSKFHGKG